MINNLYDVYRGGVLTRKEAEILNNTWDVITDKIGTKETIGINTNLTTFRYNRMLGLIQANAFVKFSSSSMGPRKIFTFNNDLPGVGINDVHIFSKDSITLIQNGQVGVSRIYPFDHTNNNYRMQVSVSYSGSFDELLFSDIIIVNAAQREAFDNYLE